MRGPTVSRVLGLSPDLDVEALGAELARESRVQVRGLFTEAAAGALHRSLAGDVPWGRAIDNPAFVDVPVADFDRQGDKQKADFREFLHAQAAERFQFLYDRFRIHWMVDRGEAIDPVLAEFHAFINGPEFLGFARRLTGRDDIAYCDSHAARYLPGHFLNLHTDEAPDGGRLFGYVVNMTPRWRSDWGGILNFIDDQGDVLRGLTPTFNALNVFAVPQAHAVSMVAPFAQGPRLTITGWLRTHKPV
ncbi:MAG TPA: 2OG-Fe(II) oxygenase family protein, partial [Caulobacteraceae bacterium]